MKAKKQKPKSRPTTKQPVEVELNDGTFPITINTNGSISHEGYVELTAADLDRLVKRSRFLRSHRKPDYSKTECHAISVRSDGVICIGCQRIKPEDADRVHAISLKMRGQK